MPAESTWKPLLFSPRSLRILKKRAAAIGLRQVFPVQTNNALYIYILLGTSRKTAGGNHRCFQSTLTSKESRVPKSSLALILTGYALASREIQTVIRETGSSILSADSFLYGVFTSSKPR